jgi:hypothetical protein
MKICVVSPYETSAADFFKAIASSKAGIVVDVRLRCQNQLCGYSKEGDLAYFVPTILGIPYVHDLRFAPEETLLHDYLIGQKDYKAYANGYKRHLDEAKALDQFAESYGKYGVVAIIGTGTKKQRSHAEALKDLLEDK